MTPSAFGTTVVDAAMNTGCDNNSRVLPWWDVHKKNTAHNLGNELSVCHFE